MYCVNMLIFLCYWHLLFNLMLTDTVIWFDILILFGRVRQLQQCCNWNISSTPMYIALRFLIEVLSFFRGM